MGCLQREEYPWGSHLLSHKPLIDVCLLAPNFPSSSCFSDRCFNEAACIEVPPVEGYVMVLQPEEPKISLSGVHHFARAASEFESPEGVSLFPELKIISTITREVEPEADGAEDPTGNSCSPVPQLASFVLTGSLLVGSFSVRFWRF